MHMHIRTNLLWLSKSLEDDRLRPFPVLSVFPLTKVSFSTRMPPDPLVLILRSFVASSYASRPIITFAYMSTCRAVELCNCCCAVAVAVVRAGGHRNNCNSSNNWPYLRSESSAGARNALKTIYWDLFG